MQKTVWAMIRLPMPRLMPSLPPISAKKDSVATAVTISGTISGRFSTMKAEVSPRQGFTRVMPRAASVAVVVAITVAETAMIIVFSARREEGVVGQRHAVPVQADAFPMGDDIAAVEREDHQDEDRDVEDREAQEGRGAEPGLFLDVEGRANLSHWQFRPVELRT